MLARQLPASVINAERAARRKRQDNAEAFDVAARQVEAIGNWLAEVWDHCLDECDDETRERAEDVAATLQAALAPYAAEIVAFHRASRADNARRGFASVFDLTLFGTTLRGEGV